MLKKEIHVYPAVHPLLVAYKVIYEDTDEQNVFYQTVFLATNK